MTNSQIPVAKSKISMTKSQIGHWSLVIGICLLAGWLRLSNLDLVEFKADEANHLLLSADFLAHPRVLATGSESSVGVEKGPLMVYLMAVPLLVSRDPRVATGFVALLNLGAVAGCYVLTRRYFGRTAAFVATLLFGVSPWAIFFSRKIFTSNLFPLFTVLFFLSIFAAVVERRARQWVWAFVWLAALLQINLFAISYVPVLVLALVLFRDRVRWPAFLAGAGLFALLFAPYLYHDYAQGWANLRGLLGAAGGTSRIDLEAFQLALKSIGGEDLSALAGISIDDYLSQRLNLGWLDAIEAGLFVAGLFVVSASALRGRAEARTTSLLLVLWFAVPVVFNTRHPVDLYLHYFSLLYPVQFIVVGVLVAAAARFAWKARLPITARWIGRGLPLALVGVISLWQVYHLAYFFQFIDRHATDYGHDTPVKYHLAVAQRMVRLSQELDASVMIWIPRSQPGMLDLLSALQFMAAPAVRPRELESTRRAVVFPRGQDHDVVYVTVPGATLPALLNRWAWELPGEQVVLPGGQSAFCFYRIPADSVAPGRVDAIEGSLPAELGEHVTLLGYDLPTRGAPSLYWRVRDVTDVNRNYSFFNHLIDDQWRKLAQSDGLEYPPRYWVAEDQVVTWYDLEIPPDAPTGRYRVITGLYDFKTGMREPVHTRSGELPGNMIQLGPIQIGAPD